jgi:hypothetical protein
MPNNGPFRVKQRRASYPFAYTLDERGNQEIVFASQLELANVPGTNTLTPAPGDVRSHVTPGKDTKFLCPACHKPLFYVPRREPVNQPNRTGRKKRAQPAFFKHGPGGAQFHINAQASEVASDLVQVIYRKAKLNLDPSIDFGTTNQAWIITLRQQLEDGSLNVVPFVISPTKTQTLTDNPDAVALTSPLVNVGSMKKLNLYDEGNYEPLSAQQIRDAIMSKSVHRFKVSGYFEPVKQDGNVIGFVPKQIPIFEAIKSIMDGSRVFVEHVDRIKYDIFPTSARWALVDAEHVERVQHMVETARPSTRRSTMSQEIAERLGLSVHQDTKVVARTAKLEYGGAYVLYVFPGMEGNPEALWKPGDNKVIVGPSPRTILKNVDISLYDGALIVFGTQKAMDEFKAEMPQLDPKNPKVNVRYALFDNDRLMDHYVRTVEKHLASEILARDQRVEATTPEVAPTLPFDVPIEPKAPARSLKRGRSR